MREDADGQIKDDYTDRFIELCLRTLVSIAFCRALSQYGRESSGAQ